MLGCLRRMKKRKKKEEEKSKKFFERELFLSHKTIKKGKNKKQ